MVDIYINKVKTLYVNISYIWCNYPFNVSIQPALVEFIIVTVALHHVFIFTPVPCQVFILQVSKVK